MRRQETGVRSQESGARGLRIVEGGREQAAVGGQQSAGWREAFRAGLAAEDLSPVTVRNYVGDVDLFARWRQEAYGEEFEPGRVVRCEVQEYRTWLQGTAAPATVNRRLASIGKLFQVLGLETPAAGVRGVKLVDPGVQALPTADLRRLRREFHARGSRRDIAMFEVLSGTAIRVGELVALRIQDVEISERRGTLTVRNGKGRSSRLIPLNVDVRAALAAWLEERPEGAGDVLFVGERGPMTASGVWRIIRAYGDRAGIEELHVHQLRHTALTRLVRESGLDLATVARISGHRDVRTLLRYVGPTSEDLRAAVETLALGGE